MSRDPHFVRKLRDVVGLYMNPPPKALVLSVDEKSQIQALDRTQPILPLRPGVPARQTHDYTRHGTTTLFAALRGLFRDIRGGPGRRHDCGRAGAVAMKNQNGFSMVLTGTGMGAQLALAGKGVDVKLKN